MATLEKAIALAAQAHAGQRDKEGLCYILHPLRVMMRVQDDSARIVAVLHDTLEDTSLTEADLRREGFSDEIIAAVKVVTHDKDEPYADYVVRCASNPIARQVKLADLEDNGRLDRTLLRPATLERDFRRIHRYNLSYKFLTGQISEQDYRAAMAAHG
jgi:hypothetical protein